MTGIADAGGSLVDTAAKANFRALGKRFGKAVQAVAAAIAATRRGGAGGRAAARTARRRSPWTASRCTLGPDEVVVTETPREGWAVASDAGATLALDLHVTPELRRAGVARDVIRQIQEARKTSGLEVSDRIVLRYRGDRRRRRPRPSREHGDLVADEVLATDYAAGRPDWAGAEPSADETLGLSFWFRKA